jgi:hypothetical protein
MIFDGFRPDRFDIAGALACLVGVGGDHVRAARTGLTACLCSSSARRVMQRPAHAP